MKALYFGTYDRSSPRNTQVVSCLRRAGVTVVERHREVWGRHNWSLGLGQMARMARAEGSLARRRDDDADVVVVGYPGHFDMPAAKRTARGRPVVFNPLVSLHDTLVGDRARFRHRSPAAGILRAVDNGAFRSADLVVADTEAHAAFFRQAFGLREERVGVALVGADEPLFRPGWHPPERFHVLFVGKLIPLHGLETILAAAALVPEVPFRVVGDGQLAGLLDGRPANVEHMPWIPYEELPDAYRAAGCALGIFGRGDKAARVIPNKVFQALACARPVVTADTPAARELLTDDTDAILVPPGDPEALAGAVRRLAADDALAERVARAGRETFEAHASEDVLGARWRSLLERAAASR
ncbi:MAG TPA: glycosyltransferase family 4 protein [Gaiella sp.]|nr:glycosyltransferase family 4 protein [Gaiella sp.]